MSSGLQGPRAILRRSPGELEGCAFFENEKDETVYGLRCLFRAELQTRGLTIGE